MTEIIYTCETHQNEILYYKMDKQRKEKETSDKEFFTSSKGWNDDMLPEGERPKYEMNKTKAFLGDIKEGQRRTNEALKPLEDRLIKEALRRNGLGIEGEGNE